MFTEGVATVRSLEEAGDIDGATSQELLQALAVLYLEALVAGASENIFGLPRPEVPNFFSWMTPHLR